MSDRVNVTKTFLPPIEEYEAYLKQIWERGWITNQGPLLKELEAGLENYLDVKNLQFVSNGTMALQLALRTLDITDGEIITTPFSYVATASAILWERCTPVFVDINPDTLCIDPAKIEQAITPKTRAIMPVHVFGIPCDVDAIEEIALRHNIKVIYDGAHAFGVTYKGKALLDNGDVSTCSFHATKLFHTIEGGCLIIRDGNVSESAKLIKQFGHDGDEHIRLGINGKASEFQAAMGLVNLTHIDEIITQRQAASEAYDARLLPYVKRPSIPEGTEYNFSYYSIILRDEAEREAVEKALNDKNIFPRRYFYPSLNMLPYLQSSDECPISESISSRVLCLPLYYGIETDVINSICDTITECIG